MIVYIVLLLVLILWLLGCRFCMGCVKDLVKRIFLILCVKFNCICCFMRCIMFICCCNCVFIIVGCWSLLFIMIIFVSCVWKFFIIWFFRYCNYVIDVKMVLIVNNFKRCLLSMYWIISKYLLSWYIIFKS